MWKVEIGNYVMIAEVPFIIFHKVFMSECRDLICYDIFLFILFFCVIVIDDFQGASLESFGFNLEL